MWVSGESVGESGREQQCRECRACPERVTKSEAATAAGPRHAAEIVAGEEAGQR